MIPYMPFYVGDYLADTMHLNTVQHGAYVLLIFHYWRNEGPIENSDETLANITKLTLSGWTATRSALEKFFEITPATWSHKRINAELDKIKRLQAAHRKGARMANKARAQRPAQRHAQRCISEPDSIHSTEPPTGFPKSEQEAADMVAVAGVPKPFAIEVYQQLVGRGYKDGAGVLISNFPAHVKSRFSRKQSDTNERKSYANRSTGNQQRRTDGNAGTANDGQADQYAGVGKVV